MRIGRCIAGFTSSPAECAEPGGGDRDHALRGFQSATRGALARLWRRGWGLRCRAAHIHTHGIALDFTLATRASVVVPPCVVCSTWLNGAARSWIERAVASVGVRRRAADGHAVQCVVHHPRLRAARRQHRDGDRGSPGRQRRGRPASAEESRRVANAFGGVGNREAVGFPDGDVEWLRAWWLRREAPSKHLTNDNANTRLESPSL
jgi:hypothetical protein